MTTLHASPLGEAPYFTRSPVNVTIPEHSTAAFSCDVMPHDTPVTWYVDGITIYESDKYELVVSGCTRCLFIHEATRYDECRYTTRVAGGAEVGAELTIEGRNKDYAT